MENMAEKFFLLPAVRVKLSRIPSTIDLGHHTVLYSMAATREFHQSARLTTQKCEEPDETVFGGSIYYSRP